jgi:hypothetical protein
MQASFIFFKRNFFFFLYNKMNFLRTYIYKKSIVKNFYTKQKYRS